MTKLTLLEVDVVVRGAMNEHEIPSLKPGRLMGQISRSVALVVALEAARSPIRGGSGLARLASGGAHVALGVRGV